MKKNQIIALSIGLGVLFVVLVGLGIWAGIYQKDLNRQRSKDRVAATELQKVSIGYDGVSTGFYPNVLFDTISYEYNSHFYEGLTTLDSNFHIQPQLAESWENPSDTVWRFRLKRNVKFHDGSIMTAQDVKASLDMAITNENTSQNLPGLVSIKVIDDYTVDLTTSSPSPLLANTLTSAFILPAKLITSGKFDSPIGTGQFEFVSSDSDTVTGKRFNDYHGTKAKIATVVLKSYTDSTARLAAIKNKEVDVIQTVDDPNLLSTDSNGQPLNVATVPGIGVSYLILDTVSDTSPYITGVSTNPFKDVRVRQAFQYALNTNQLSSTVGPYAIPPSQIVAPSIFGFDPSIKAATQNIDQAKQLMTAAGFANGFTLTLDIASGKSWEPSFTENLQAQLAKIGITLKVNLANADSTFYQKISSGDSAMFYMEYDCGTGDALEAYENLFGKQAFYSKAYQTPAMLDLITQTEGTFDLAKRKSNLLQLAQLADQSKAVIPMFTIKPSASYRQGINLTMRFDGFITATNISGAVPTSFQKDYTYWDTVRKMLGFKI